MKHSLIIDINKLKKRYLLPKNPKIYVKGLLWMLTKPSLFINKFFLVLEREALVKQYNKNYQNYLKLKQKNEIRQLNFKPKISILLPTYNSPNKYLKQCLNSVLNQKYKNWELCIADDASTNKKTINLLKKYQNKDKRIKIIFKSKNTHISDTTNIAFSMATGEYVALLDHDDLIYPNTLYEYVKVINEKPKTEVIYCDEDKIDKNNYRFDPHFKPDFSFYTLLSGNYITHFLLVKKDFFQKVGKLRRGFEGAQDYDLILRLADQSNKICHIPQVLYSWRTLKQSTASATSNAKSYAYRAGVRSLESYLKRHKLPGYVTFGEGRGLYEFHLKAKQNAKIVVLIEQKDINRWDKKYIFVLRNKKNTLGKQFLDILNNRDINYLFFTNDKLKLNNLYSILEQSLGLFRLSKLAILGRKLVYKNGRIYHVGYILFRKQNKINILDAFHNMKIGGYFNFNYSKMIRNYSAVSALGAILNLDFFRKQLTLVDKKFIKQINSYRDLGLFLSLIAKNNRWLVVSHPNKIILQKKMKKEVQSKINVKILRLWEKEFKNYDSFYNPNLTVEKTNFSIKLITKKDD